MRQDPSRTQARAIGIAAVAAFGGFLFGFDSAVINGAVDAVRGEFGLDATRIDALLRATR